MSGILKPNILSLNQQSRIGSTIISEKNTHRLSGVEANVLVDGGCEDEAASLGR